MRTLLSIIISWFIGVEYWEINKRLYGWDYIYWQNRVASGVTRIYKCESGQAYYWRYKSIPLADVVERPEQVLWLTCSPSDYLKTHYNAVERANQAVRNLEQELESYDYEQAEKKEKAPNKVQS